MSKTRPAAPVKTKNYIIKNVSDDALATFGKAWEVRRAPSKKDPSRDCDTILASLTYYEGDEYHCSELVVGETIALDKLAWKEILNVINPAICTYQTVEFIRTKKGTLSAGLIDALTELKFVSDPVDEDYIIWESALPTWTTVYMCLGIAIGMSVYKVYGMSLGMLFGLAIGYSMDNHAKKARKDLKEARNNSAKTEE